MHRAADVLVSNGMIEQKMEQGAKGQPVRLIRKLNVATRKKNR
jgi:hypothetical protein